MTWTIRSNTGYGGDYPSYKTLKGAEKACAKLNAKHVGYFTFSIVEEQSFVPTTVWATDSQGNLIRVR